MEITVRTNMPYNTGSNCYNFRTFCFTCALDLYKVWQTFLSSLIYKSFKWLSCYIFVKINGKYSSKQSVQWDHDCCITRFNLIYIGPSAQSGCFCYVIMSPINYVCRRSDTVWNTFCLQSCISLNISLNSNTKIYYFLIEKLNVFQRL